MKCINCDYCKKGWYKIEPEKYVCTGVKHPFIIKDVNQDCTEYPERNKERIKTATIYQPENVKAFVGDDAIYVPSNVYGCHTKLISKELFVEAYNKWIKGECVNE